MPDDNEFMRAQAEHAWDTMQLASIKALQYCLVDYATNAWRKIDEVPPPINVPVLAIGAPGEGVLVLVLTQNGEWRTTMGGQPHKPPTLWMPCPNLPKGDRLETTKLSVAK